MTIPEKALRAAQEATEGGFGITDDYMRRALTAALPFLQGVKVKVLEWRDNEAQSPAGSYRVQRLDNKWEPLHNGFYMLPRVHGVVKAFDTLDAAKAAAQSDYSARILSAIEPSPTPRAQALEEAAQWHESEAEAYDAEEGGPDITGRLLAQEHRISAIAIRALSSQPVADGWLPIETAPKDGTPFVALGKNYEQAQAHITCRVGYQEGSRGHEQGNTDTWLEYVERDTCFRWEPTYWRPLPSSQGASDTRPTGGNNAEA